MKALILAEMKEKTEAFQLIKKASRFAQLLRRLSFST